MQAKYEITRETLAILPINSKQSKVLEKEREVLVNRSTTEIIDDSCKFFGSSYMGRFEGTKELVGFKYKAPIIVEESNEIIFFPTSSPRLKDCMWINLNNIKNYKKSGSKTILTFYNNQNLTIPISFGCIENQILRATRLSSILIQNKYRLH